MKTLILIVLGMAFSFLILLVIGLMVSASRASRAEERMIAEYEAKRPQQR